MYFSLSNLTISRSKIDDFLIKKDDILAGVFSPKKMTFVIPSLFNETRVHLVFQLQKLTRCDLNLAEKIKRICEHVGKTELQGQKIKITMTAATLCSSTNEAMRITCLTGPFFGFFSYSELQLGPETVLTRETSKKLKGDNPVIVVA